jgi:hypothetical protein
MRVAHLFVVTAIVELGAGAALLAAPSALSALLLGSPLPEGAGVVVARVAGVALVALGTICALARRDEHSAATKAIIAGLALYNVVVALVLVLAAAVMGMMGPLLWPSVVAHAALTVLCIAARRRADTASTLSSFRRRVATPRSRQTEPPP